MQTPIRLALVGTGGRGQIYVDALASLGPGRAIWTAMCDTNPEVLAAFCERNALKVPQIGDAREVAGRDDVDAVLICTPDHVHRDPAVACLEAGKHVLIEKPLATEQADAQAICAAARRSGKLLHPGFVMRYDPCVLKLRELVRDGAVGRPIVCMAHEAVGWFHGATYMRRWNRWRQYSGDLLLHKGCHTFDLINMICGAMPLRVSAFGGTEVFTPRPGAAAHCRDCALTADCIYVADQGEAYRKRFRETAGPQRLPEDVCVYNVAKDTSDTVTLVAEYDNGMRLSYTMTLVSPRGERRLTLIGTGGELRCDLGRGQIALTPLPDQPTTTIAVEPVPGSGHQYHDKALLADFLDRIVRDDDPASGIEAAAMSGATAFAGLRSMESGEAIRIRDIVGE